MRIVSGTYKGRNLLGYDLKGTRPTMDRVKESLFAMIQDKIKESNCLDLFAGSGNLGLEALSQGASIVTFVDHNKKAIDTIKQNIQHLSIKEPIHLYKLDFQQALKQLPANAFDIIFLDPPYDTDAIEIALRKIHDYQLLKDDGYIILESNKLEKVLPKQIYQVLKYKKYGDKYISIIKKAND